LAIEISKKSPIALIGIKQTLNYSRDHTVQEGLDYVANLNSVMLHSEDLQTSIQAQIEKKVPIYSKL
jgi:enoyl-CoA hydratase/carnithine racemase